jgi:hypothetical protein
MAESGNILRDSTLALLSRLHSRRENRRTDRKDVDGFWLFSRPRCRSVADYERIATFARATQKARHIAQRESDRLVAEARRFAAIQKAEAANG